MLIANATGGKCVVMIRLDLAVFLILSGQLFAKVDFTFVVELSFKLGQGAEPIKR